jgi:hypothetical protein
MEAATDDEENGSVSKAAPAGCTDKDMADLKLVLESYAGRGRGGRSVPSSYIVLATDVPVIRRRSP